MRAWPLLGMVQCYVVEWERWSGRSGTTLGVVRGRALVASGWWGALTGGVTCQRDGLGETCPRCAAGGWSGSGGRRPNAVLACARGRHSCWWRAEGGGTLVFFRARGGFRLLS